MNIDEEIELVKKLLAGKNCDNCVNSYDENICFIFINDSLDSYNKKKLKTCWHWRGE